MARPSSFDRQEALAKARDLFWRKGFHATSLKDLEATLALKPGSIYAAFGNKEALFVESLELYAEDSEGHLRRLMDGAASPLAALAGYVRSFAGEKTLNTPSPACMIVKTILEVSDGPTDLKQTAEGLFNNMAAIFAEMFQRAVDQGEISATVDPVRLAKRLQANIVGLRAMAQSHPPQAVLEQLADDMAKDIEALRLPAGMGHH